MSVNMRGLCGNGRPRPFGRAKLDSTFVLKREPPKTPGYFFKIGLYPSPISLVRMASASFTSEYGPTCT